LVSLTVHYLESRIFSFAAALGKLLGTASLESWPLLKHFR